MAEAMDPIKKIWQIDSLYYVLSWENNNNGTQGNNKTTTKKDNDRQSEHAVPAGKLEMWAKVIIKFTNLTRQPTRVFTWLLKHH